MSTPRPHIRPARHRHGRGARGPLLPHNTPRYRSSAERFDMAVLEAYAPIHNAFAEQLIGLDLAVDTVPRMRLSVDMTVMPDEIIADGPVPLGRIVPAPAWSFSACPLKSACSRHRNARNCYRPYLPH